MCSCSSLLFLHALTLGVELVVRVRNLLLLHVGWDCDEGWLAGCAEHLLTGLLVILYTIRWVCSLSARVSATFLHVDLVVLLLAMLDNALYAGASVPASIRTARKSIITLLQAGYALRACCRQLEVARLLRETAELARVIDDCCLLRDANIWMLLLEVGSNVLGRDSNGTTQAHDNAIGWLMLKDGCKLLYN